MPIVILLNNNSLNLDTVQIRISNNSLNLDTVQIRIRSLKDTIRIRRIS